MPPVEGKVRCNYLNLPLINGDRLRTAKTLVDKAIKVRLLNSMNLCRSSASNNCKGSLIIKYNDDNEISMNIH